jgi:hypothetical protein
MDRGKGVLDAIDRSVSLRSRSLLSAWMRENHDAFQARLDARIPDWKVLTDLFSDAGLTDRYGKKPKPESARKLWQRIKKEIELERSKKPPPRPTTTRQSSSLVESRQSEATKPAAAPNSDDILKRMASRSGLPDPIT